MSYKWRFIICLMPAMTLVTVDMTIVNVALAKLAAVFGVDVSTVGWTVTGFALAMGIATPMASFVETRFTLKRVWTATMLLFT
ncbi:MAG TPA: MFS transporter, partial [Chloroflexota bacterium]